ncbi:aldo/keto reductase [Aestuariimicrobium sp. T2.26MG-19.2B]|uniref:aldo/keto reductase n=1 Tax=Aestuariimicrobium sp. T2.26MG-19.2B TaxID=3040679 RepID=UPI002542283C|nr:aldo/keto reductase [Aestuariimicrobium sp. T2.26MG-19.2B]
MTKLGYGAMEVRGSRIWGGRPIEDSEAETILNAVVDEGITFIDTANDYGRSEEYIGRYLSHRRDEFVLATKCGCTVVHKDETTDDTPHVWTKDNLFRGLHESLERMKTDHVDLMQLHNPSVEQVEEGGLVEALQEMKQQGKVRWIGISSTNPHLETFIESGVFDSFQIPYSALEREHEELIQKASDSGAGVIVRGGVARGEPGSGLGAEDRWAAWEAAGLDDLREEGESRTAFLLRFTNSHPGMDTNIVGTKSVAHLKDNIAAAARGPLPDDVYAEAKKRLGAHS